MNSYDQNDKIIEKINTFKALVENNNDEIALKFLEKSGWDETVKILNLPFKRKLLNSIMKIKVNHLQEIFIQMKTCRIGTK